MLRLLFWRRKKEPNQAGGGGLRLLRTAAVLDVETTGLDPRRDEIIELAIVLFQFDPAGAIVRESVEEYVGLREPSIPIPPEATRVHGLTDRDVAGRRLDEARIRALAARAEFIVAHNARFDRPFVERLLPDVFRGKTWLCTCHGVDWKARGAPSKSLPVLTRHFGIRHTAHRALGDARATLALLRVRDPDGRTVLAELLERAGRFDVSLERNGGAPAPAEPLEKDLAARVKRRHQG